MKNIGIFCGGFSSEFDISIKSANTILASLPQKYNAFLIIVKRGDWRVQLDGESLPLDLNDLSFETKTGKEKVEVGLVYIHGNPGENGKIQAFLEMKNIPCINSGALASELSFDKWFCNQFIRGFDINVAKSLLFRKGDLWNSDQIVNELGLPLFVKPSDSGSSFGISKVNVIGELPNAMNKAFAEGETVVLESFLNGTELTCGVYRSVNGEHALPITEIVAESDFFDYDAKYLGKSQEITPARIGKRETELVQATAIKIYQLLRLRSIARIDFMLVEGIPFVIEVNTTPGFSEASIVPKMLGVEGKSLKDFWSEILEVEMPTES
ncbi:MAG: D-alanine--D-alanine ligase [Bacteroidetes bacterium]|nr:D-alanine--D-alanine ligase [Bacteroidota bacterium]